MAVDCRDRMITAGWTRKGCNRGLRMIRMMFRWGVSQEIVRPDTLARLQAIEPLRVNRTRAPESDPVQPVPDAAIAAIERHVAPPIWALVRVQRLCGARGGELVTLRAVDIDKTGSVWVYRPINHKTSHRGHERIIYFGPRAQAILKPLIESRDASAYLFCPREGHAARMAKRRTTGPGRRPNQKPNPRRTERVIGPHYTPTTYRKAIERACKLAGIDIWTPHQLRHSAATGWRRNFGPDAALTLLGDKTSNLVEVYAERDHMTAMRIAAEVG